LYPTLGGRILRGVEVAIVGVGPWGLCVLERLVARAHLGVRDLTIHVVEPGVPGTGVYSTDLPDYLVLNNPCGQLSAYARPVEGRDPPYGLGLYDWAVSTGYRWRDRRCVLDPAGRPIDPAEFLPRRLMGEYLAWFFEAVVADAPPGVDVVVHRSAAVDLVAEGGRERVVLASGGSVLADHVVLTSGHTPNLAGEGSAGAFVDPYPVSRFETWPGPGETAVVAGMGLVAYDVIAAMTIGRGGVFVGSGRRLGYRRSGTEPQVALYSRTGVPPLAKPDSVGDPTGAYRPVIATPERLSRLRPGSIDFRTDVLPLVLAEMQVRYYLVASGDDGVPGRLGEAWSAGRFVEEIAGLADRHGPYDPARHFGSGLDRPLLSAKDYESQVYDLVAADLDEAIAGPGRSPVKAALETTRILRDTLRPVLELGALSLPSHLDFQQGIRPRINHLEAGPPLARSQQLLALLDAGVVTLPLGPSPSVDARADGLRFTSTALVSPAELEVAAAVRGYLDMPSLVRTASPLLASLLERGRLQPLRYGDFAAGSVAIDEDFHPIDSSGGPGRSITVLGVLTEGSRYFTHYLPSPKSRLRAVLDAEAVAEEIIGRAPGRGRRSGHRRAPSRPTVGSCRG